MHDEIEYLNAGIFHLADSLYYENKESLAMCY